MKTPRRINRKDLNRDFKLNKYTGLIFVLAFAAIGYLIVHSYAASPTGNSILANNTIGNASPNNVITLVKESFGGYSSSVQIAPDGLPVIAIGEGGILTYMHCMNLTCTSYHFSYIDSGEVGIQGDYVYMAIGKDGLPIISYDDYQNKDLRMLHCGDLDCNYSGDTITHITTPDADGETSKTVIGSDGLPVVIFNDDTTSDVEVLHCGNAACSSGNTTTVIHTPDADGQDYTTIAIGGDGLPILGYPDSTTGHIGVTKCANLDCTSIASMFDISDAKGVYPSMFIGSDGLPVMSYTSTAAGSADDLGVIHCGNLACNAGNTVTVMSTSDDDGRFARLIISGDGLPLIAYHDATDRNIYVVKCGNVLCSSGNKTTHLPDSHHVGNTLSLKNGKDGLPIIAYSDASVVPFELGVLHCGTTDCSDTGSPGTAIPGDANGDGHVDALDLSVLLNYWNTSYAKADFNSDGIVDALDLSALLNNWGR